MAILVAYYSRAGENYFGGQYRNIDIGNTEKAANMIAALTNGDLLKIEQKIPYSENYQSCIAQAKHDLQNKARPELVNLPDNLDKYDAIYLGYPNYWGTINRHFQANTDAVGQSGFSCRYCRPINPWPMPQTL